MPPKSKSKAQSASLRKPREKGRRTRLTPEIQERIVTLVRAGHYKRVAAAQAGVAERTLYQWYDKGDQDHEAHRRIYAQFRQALDEAEAESEIILLDKITKHGTPRDHLEVLARRFPERWGRRINVEAQHQGEINHDHRGTIGHVGEPAAVRIIIADNGDTWQQGDDPGFSDAAVTLLETKAER